MSDPWIDDETLQRLTSDGQSNDAVSSMYKRWLEFKTFRENMICVFFQMKPILASAFIATHERLYILRPTLTGGCKYEAYFWKGMNSVSIYEGILLSNVSLKLTPRAINDLKYKWDEKKIVGRTINMTFLSKRHARRLYAICKQFEYYWWYEWKRRDMMLAHAGAPNIGPQFFAVDEPYRPRQMVEMPPEMDDALMAKLTAQDQEPDLVQEMYDKMRQLMTAYEHIEGMFFQHKAAIFPAIITVTNWRVFTYRFMPSGNAQIHDYWLPRLTQVKLTEDPLFMTVTAYLREFNETETGRIESFVNTQVKPGFKIGFLPKDQGMRLAQMLKDWELWWLDEFRRYELQYNRAASGVTSFFDYGMPSDPYSELTQTSIEDPNAPEVLEDRATRIRKLQSMWSQGLLTAEEYHALNKAIMENKPVDLDPEGVRIDDSHLGTSSLRDFKRHSQIRNNWDAF